MYFVLHIHMYAHDTNFIWQRTKETLLTCVLRIGGIQWNIKFLNCKITVAFEVKCIVCVCRSVVHTLFPIRYSRATNGNVIGASIPQENNYYLVCANSLHMVFKRAFGRRILYLRGTHTHTHTLTFTCNRCKEPRQQYSSCINLETNERKNIE